MFLVDRLILIGAVLLLIGIISSKLSARFGVPVLVLFLAVGMLAGEDGIGRIEFDDYRLAHAIGTLALAVILFDGGLRTPARSVRVAWAPAALLATVGVVLTAGATGLLASWLWAYRSSMVCCWGASWLPRTPPRCSRSSAPVGSTWVAALPRPWRSRAAPTIRWRSC